jgi:PhnB protein
MNVNTYLNFPGTCAEAIAFYEQHLGAKLMMKMTFSQMPGDPKNIPAGMENSVLHAQFTLGDAILMASDGPRAEPMRSAYISLAVDSDEEAERIYKVLTEGGEVFMKMEETFFAHRFGQLRDKFGVNWMVLHAKPMPQG